jgi:hypothetical protein
MKTERKVNIGITIAITDYSDSLFTNGIRQNVLILRDLYEKCKNVKNAYIINTASPKNIDEINEELKPYLKHIITLQDSLEKCDLIVIGHGSISPETSSIFKQKGKKLTKHIMGPELSTFNETILFKDNEQARNVYIRNSGTVSAVWISAHYYNRDRYFFETMYDTEVVIAPYVWDQRFIESHIEKLLTLENNTHTGYYVPSGKKEKRICSMEPNINIVKTSVLPIMINEHFYRKNPELIDRCYLFAADKIKTKKDLINFVKDLDVYKAKKMFFESRYPIVWTLQKHTDIVLSHQNQNELNYLYLDASWMGYPVVHNSPMMKELGWYYEENDVKTAVEHLSYISKYFDENEHLNNEYLNKSRNFAYKYKIENPENIRGYEKLIDKAMNS